MDPLRELPYGPAAFDSRIRGRTHVSTRPRSRLFQKILLAPTGSSTHVHKDSSQHRASLGKAAITGITGCLLFFVVTAEYERLVDVFGVRRSNQNFWSFFDEINSIQLTSSPVGSGALDLTRYAPDAK